MHVENNDTKGRFVWQWWIIILVRQIMKKWCYYLTLWWNLLYEVVTYTCLELPRKIIGG